MVAENSPSEYESLKGTEIEEFYRILDLWYATKKKEMEALK